MDTHFYIWTHLFWPLINESLAYKLMASWSDEHDSFEICFRLIFNPTTKIKTSFFKIIIELCDVWKVLAIQFKLVKILTFLCRKLLFAILLAIYAEMHPFVSKTIDSMSKIVNIVCAKIASHFISHSTEIPLSRTHRIGSNLNDCCCCCSSSTAIPYDFDLTAVYRCVSETKMLITSIKFIKYKTYSFTHYAVL